VTYPWIARENMSSILQNRIRLLSSHRQYLRLWIGLTQSHLGTLINLIALSLHVYDKTRSGTAVGFMEISMVVPSVVVGFLAGAVVDRYDKKWIMAGADLIRGALFMAMAFTPYLPFYYVIIFASSLVGLFFSPAYSASLPLILEKRGLMEANSLSQMSSQVVRIVGPGIAGLMYVQFGFPFICIFNGVTFLISAAIIMSLSIPPSLSPKRPWNGLGTTLWDAVDGIRLIKSISFAKWALLSYAGMQLGAGAIVVLVVIFVKDALHGSDAVYGLIISATAAGSFAGALITWFRGRLNESILMRIAFIILGISVMLISVSINVWLVLVLFVFVGFSQTALSIAIDSLLQKHIPESMMGRTFGTIGAVAQVSQLISMGLGSVCSDIFGVRSVYIAAGALVMITAIIATRRIPIPSSVPEPAIL
jgi:DHA3 family macrolide efflux protein-like MFS transporter